MRCVMKSVSKDRFTTINELPTSLGMKHRADFACPITTAIFF